jgi:glycosyltransferase involved in cell wall biosynthesis
MVSVEFRAVAQALVLVSEAALQNRSSLADDSKPPRTLLTIAPGHFIFDERVLRTVQAGTRFTRNIYAVDREMYERTNSSDETIATKIAARIGSHVEIVLLPAWPRLLFLNRAMRHVYAVRIARLGRAVAPDVVHIHEAGLLGLLIAFWIRKLVPGARIIFDYHDWIPYELSYLVRQIRPLYHASTRITMPLLRRLARAVDVAVCISPGQAEWTRKSLGIRDTIVIQNVRPRTVAPVFSVDEVHRELVFAGNVMRIRRLEFIVDVLTQLHARSSGARLHVFGEIVDQKYATEVSDYARNNGLEDAVLFHGRYFGDRSLTEHVRRGSVGVLLSMQDNLDTGINRIASANKFFSYLSLGLPVLVQSQYQNMAEITRRYGAGLVFQDVDQCADAAQQMWDTPGLWDSMREGALAAANVLNAETYRNELEGLYPL